jgi:hypothetical protein
MDLPEKVKPLIPALDRTVRRECQHKIVAMKRDRADESQPSAIAAALIGIRVNRECVDDRSAK